MFIQKYSSLSLWLAALIALDGTAGCKLSNRQISMGDKVIAVHPPIQVKVDSLSSMPIAASPNGKRIAFESDGPKGMVRVDVLDTDSQKVLGTTEMPNGGGTPMFSRQGSLLYIPDLQGYMGWNYTTGEKTKVAESSPLPSEFAFMDDSGWNYDRTIAIQYPQVSRSTANQVNPGQVAISGGKTFKINPNQHAGFDEFGNAWFGKGAYWQRIDRSGAAVMGGHPGSLAHDQTRDRGSMHLTQTENDVKQGDATASISCIWLTDDKSTPYRWTDKGKTVTEKEPHKVALVFAGADVIDYGFLPGRRIVYVVSGFEDGNEGPIFQTQLIPLTEGSRPRFPPRTG